MQQLSVLAPVQSTCSSITVPTVGGLQAVVVHLVSDSNTDLKSVKYCFCSVSISPAEMGFRFLYLNIVQHRIYIFFSDIIQGFERTGVWRNGYLL